MLNVLGLLPRIADFNPRIAEVAKLDRTLVLGATAN